MIQERRAEKALAALRQLAAPEAQVLRDGIRQSISARELVPGDIVLLQSGDSVPADMRLVRVKSLQVQEAALTGDLRRAWDASSAAAGALMLEAQKNPEKYRDLVVRVAGYCAYFTDLSPAQQAEIIARTEEHMG